MNKIVYDIHQIIEEAFDCYKNKQYLSSLMIAVMLPDICSKIENNSKKSRHEIYVKWCNKWMYSYFGGILPNFTNSYKDKFGEIIYLLRCSLFHNGENNLTDFSSKFFTLKNFTFYIYENNDNLLDNSMIITKKKITGMLKFKNELNIKINLGFFIHSLLYSSLLFINKNNINDTKLEIEILRN